MQSLLSISETAKFLNISTSSLYRLTSRKQIPYIKIGARVVFKVGAIESWLEERSINPGGDGV